MTVTWDVSSPSVFSAERLICCLFWSSGVHSWGQDRRSLSVSSMSRLCPSCSWAGILQSPQLRCLSRHVIIAYNCWYMATKSTRIFLLDSAYWDVSCKKRIEISLAYQAWECTHKVTTKTTEIKCWCARIQQLLSWKQRVNCLQKLWGCSITWLYSLYSPRERDLSLGHRGTIYHIVSLKWLSRFVNPHRKKYGNFKSIIPVYTTSRVAYMVLTL